MRAEGWGWGGGGEVVEESVHGTPTQQQCLTSGNGHCIYLPTSFFISLFSGETIQLVLNPSTGLYDKSPAYNSTPVEAFYYRPDKPEDLPAFLASGILESHGALWNTGWTDMDYYGDFQQAIRICRVPPAATPPPSPLPMAREFI